MLLKMIRKIIPVSIRIIPYKCKRFIMIPYHKCKRFIKRILFATRYYNARYVKIFKWAFTSHEVANFTYDLTDTNIQYLASTISVVTHQPYHLILSYIDEARNDTDIKNHIINKISSSPLRDEADLRYELGRRLGWYAFVRAIKPKVVIETGVDKGHGAVTLCAALLKNATEGHIGQYYGTDIDPNAGYLLDGKYKTVGQVLYGDSIESLKSLSVEIDLFINDSDHSADYEYNEYNCIKEKLAPTAIILGDNAHITNKLFQFSIENNRKFIFFHESPRDHWYPGAGIGISF